MASFLNSVRQGFSRPSNRPSPQPRSGTSPSPSPVLVQPTSHLPQRAPPLPHSPAPGATPSMNDQEPAIMDRDGQRQLPMFLHDASQVFLVKGNYMTLAVKPKAVDMGEWVAHQVVEQYRNLSKFIDIIQASEPGKAPLCNTASCPTMTAGNHTYTWLDSSRQPTRLAAFRYIELVQKWIKGKINDQTLFPIDGSPDVIAATYASGGVNTPGSTTPIAAGPSNVNLPLSTLAGPADWIGRSSGFPQHFFQDCRNMYKQMFRVYAHIYWNHFEWPFYHADMERWLNSSFMLFVIIGTELELLSLKDLEPMQTLLEKWFALDKFPADCRYLVMISSSSSSPSSSSSSSLASAAAAATAAAAASGSTSSSYFYPNQQQQQQQFQHPHQQQGQQQYLPHSNRLQHHLHSDRSPSGSVINSSSTTSNTTSTPTTTPPTSFSRHPPPHAPSPPIITTTTLPPTTNPIVGTPTPTTTLPVITAPPSLPPPPSSSSSPSPSPLA